MERKHPDGHLLDTQRLSAVGGGVGELHPLAVARASHSQPRHRGNSFASSLEKPPPVGEKGVARLAPRRSGNQDDIVLLQVMERLGELTGSMGQMNERMGEMAEAQREQGSTLRVFASDNSAQHQKTDRELGSLRSEVQGLEGRMVTLEERFNKQQPPEPPAPKDKTPFYKRLEEAGTFLRAWGPWFFTALVGVWYWLTGTTPKGGTGP